jgi:GNAT superfamily N-acetyltransferase
MKQLAMLHLMNEIEDYPVPEGFHIRTYRPGEENIWVEICKNGLCGPDADISAWNNSILDQETIIPQRDVFFVCDENDVPKATITGFVMRNTRGDIHMVAASEEVRGKNIGRAMLSHAMKKLAAEMVWRPRMTRLTTDDWRIPAIVGYLKAGFRPVLYDEGMEERWRAICDKLDLHGIEMVDEEGKDTGIIL